MRASVCLSLSVFLLQGQGGAGFLSFFGAGAGACAGAVLFHFFFPPSDFV